MNAVRAGAMVAAALLFAMIPARPAAACSPIRGYRVPTTLDLAATADGIVIARAHGQRRGREAYDTTVLATPIALLKGKAMPAGIEIEGAMLTTDPRLVFRSDPRELREPNPGALTGGCVRQTFRPGMKVLLFLKRDARGKLVPYRSTFARDAEDVDGAGSLWAKVVREYVAIAAVPERGRKQAMQRRIRTLRATGRPDDAAIARDMTIELTARHRPSSG